MQINIAIEKAHVTILNERGDVALEYKVESSAFTADIRTLIDAVAALVSQVATHTATIKKL